MAFKIKGWSGWWSHIGPIRVVGTIARPTTITLERSKVMNNRKIQMELMKEPMKDTLMDLHPDPMVIPTLGDDWVYNGGSTYVVELRDYIEWVLTSDKVDPMDSAVIY